MPVKTTPIQHEAQDKRSSEMMHLESAILSKARDQTYYTKLQDWLISQQTDDASPQICSVEMMKKIITVLQGELQCNQFQQARVIVLALQHVTKFQDFSPGLPVLLSSGLIEILVYAFQVTQTHISKCGSNSFAEKENRADTFMQTLLETANDVADYSPEAKQLTIMKFTDKLMDLIIDYRKVFQIRMEAQRTLNLLLENCPGHLTQSLTESEIVKNLMQKMAEMLPLLGDFEMQVACTEALARLVTKSKRPAFAAKWFPNNNFASAFLKIQDLNFETDCRKFLNFVNGVQGAKRSVHSFPCQEAFLGGFKLHQPPDENLPDFWVDFNSASQSITMYVAEISENDEEDDSMWETVTIKGNLIKSYSLTKQANSQKLQLELMIPARDILHFCPSKQRSATISFESSIDINTALVSSLGEEKVSPPLPSQNKASVSKVNVRVNRGELTSMGLINGHPVAAEPRQRHHIQGNLQPVGTPTRPKVSVPIVPMRTPTQTSYRSSPSVASTLSTQNGYTSSGSKSSRNSYQPKTPTRSSSSGTKKVKTPLQIVVADKHPASSTPNESGIKLPNSSKKVSSTAAAIAINSGRQRVKIDAEVVKPTKENIGSGKDTRSKKKSVLKSKLSQHPNGNEKTNSDHQSKSEEPTPEHSKVLQEINQDQADTNKTSEPGESNSQTNEKKTRRSSTHKAKMTTSSQESQDEDNRKQGRQTRSKKFKLYSADNSMLLPDSQENGRRRSQRGKKGKAQEKEEEQKEPTSTETTDKNEQKQANTKTQKRGGKKKKATPDSSQEEFVIPSSVPGTQDADIIPPSFQAMHVPEHLIAVAQRRLEENVHVNSSICHSPSLSTITEESTQSRKSNSTEIQTIVQRNKEHPTCALSPFGKKNARQTQATTMGNKQTNQDKDMKVKGRSKNSPTYEHEKVPKPQLSVVAQIEDTDVNKKMEKTKIKSAQAVESKTDKRDPYHFTDTESINSINLLKSKEDKDKQQPGKNGTNKRGAAKVSDDGKIPTAKAKGSQMSTQAFSPELTQESPYLSQNDFRSPINLAGAKSKHGKGKGKKTTEKKSKSAVRGKQKSQSDAKQEDDSLSDVEIMRDANTSASSVKDKYSNMISLDDDNSYHGEEIYQLSGDIASKLTKKRAELEQFLSTGRERKRSFDQREMNSSNISTALSEVSNTGKETPEVESKDSSKRKCGEVDKKRGKNVFSNFVKPGANAFSNFTKPYVDPAFLKFPTRPGPIPTPDALEEESKKMQKRKKKQSSTMPFHWEDSEEEDIAFVNSSDEEYTTKGSKTKEGKQKNGYLDDDSDVDVMGCQLDDVYGYEEESEGECCHQKPVLKAKEVRKRVEKQKGRPQEVKKMISKHKGVKDSDIESELKKDDVEQKRSSNARRQSNGQVDGRSDELSEQRKNEAEEKMERGDFMQVKLTRKMMDATRSRINVEEVDLQMNINLYKEKADNRGKQRRYSAVTDEENDFLERSKQQKKVVKNKGKQSKQEMKKTQKDDSTKEEAENGEVQDSHDDEIQETKQKEKSKGRGKQRKQQTRKMPKDVSTEEDSEIEEVQDSRCSDYEIQNTKQKAKSKGRGKQKKHQARKTSTEEDSEIEEVQDSHHSDYEIQNTKQKAKSKGRGKQKKHQARKTSTEEESEIEEVQDSHHSDYEIQNTKQKAKSKGRGKHKKHQARKTSTEEDSEIEEVQDSHHSDYEIQNAKQKAEINGREKQRKQQAKKMPKDVSTEDDSENGEMQDNPQSESIKPQKENVKNRGKQIKQNARKYLEDYSSEGETESNEMQDTHYRHNEIQSRPTKTRQEKKKHNKQPAKSNKQGEVSPDSKRQKKEQSRKFSSQIEEDESDEIAEEQNNDGDQDKDFDSKSVTSVESFHSLCKKLLEHSGDGIGATRSRRHIPKVNYKDPENSEKDLSVSGSSESSAPNTSQRHLSKAKTPKDAVEISPPTMPKRCKFDDAQSTISNLSWLVEKPKQQVSTYSKNRAQEWIGIGSPVNLDTVSAKKKPKPKARPAGAVSQKKPPALPKKPPALTKKSKRPRISSDEEDDAYMYYYREEDTLSRKRPNKNDQTSNSKKPKLSKRQNKWQHNDEEEELDDIETMRSQQSRHNTTPVCSALLDYNTPNHDDVDLYPMTPASLILNDDEMPLSQLSLAITPRRDSIASSSRTPKLVTFEDDNITDEQDVDNDDDLLSGPVKAPTRPTESALKRKYPDMSEVSDDESSLARDEEEDDQPLLSQSQGQGMLKPKNLFASTFTCALQKKRKSFVLEDDGDDVAVDEAESSDGVPSLPSYDSDNAMMQMTQMMKVIGENIRDKMRRKEASAQKLTESSLKTAQKQVSKLWAGQQKARRKTQDEFQDKLLTQIVGLESDLNEMETSLNRSQALLQQHQRKVSTTLVNHVKKVHKLENEYRKEGEGLEVELGQHLVRNVKGLLRQGLSDMQKKMVQDVQHHEIQSMKRSLQSFLC